MRGRRASRSAGAALVATALWAAACCGPLVAEDRTPVAATGRKAMDRVHEAIAARGEGRLYAGAAAVDITTEWGRRGDLYMGGFDLGRRNRGGVRDPIFARALFLDDGTAPLVLVTIDTIGYLSNDVALARTGITDRFADRVIIAATHDHAAPDTIGIWGCSFAGVIPLCSGRVPGYMAELRVRIAEAVERAAESARPARLRTATGRMDPALCSNVHDEIEMQKDDSLRLLAFEEPDGRPIATVANWGCHAEAMWNDDQLTADFPGVWERLWESEVGGVPIFVEGAQGGLVAPNPYWDRPGEKKKGHDLTADEFPVPLRVALMQHIGAALHRTAKEALAGATPVFGPDGLQIASARAVFELPNDNGIFTWLGNRGIIWRTVRSEGTRSFLTSEVIAARFRAAGAVVADLVTIPGEPAPPFLAEVDAGSDAPLKVNVALANDEIGYILREADWSREYYGYERTMSLGKTTATLLLRAIVGLRNDL